MNDIAIKLKTNKHLCEQLCCCWGVYVYFLGQSLNWAANLLYSPCSHSICGLWWIVDCDDIGQIWTPHDLFFLKIGWQRLKRRYLGSSLPSPQEALRRSCLHFKLSFPHSVPYSVSRCWLLTFHLGAPWSSSWSIWKWEETVELLQPAGAGNRDDAKCLARAVIYMKELSYPEWQQCMYWETIQRLT